MRQLCFHESIWLRGTRLKVKSGLSLLCVKRKDTTVFRDTGQAIRIKSERKNQVRHKRFGVNCGRI